MTDIDTMARGFLAAQRANQPYVPPSAGRELDMDQALAVQRAFNALRGATEPVAGFKAAANPEPIQRALGLASPVTGTLFAGGERVPGCVVQRAAYRTLLIETELGFRVGRRIDAPVGTIDALRDAIADCAAMIELADPGFGRAAIRGTDLIATNSATAGFIRGPALPLPQLNVNDVRIVLSRDGEPLHDVRADLLLGDQWQALLWLVNTIVGQQQVIEPGHLLMTGALGPAHPAVPGVYSASFSGLGEIGFEVV
jgi:2-keto-4-pentenoate hydratase